MKCQDSMNFWNKLHVFACYQTTTENGIHFKNVCLPTVVAEWQIESHYGGRTKQKNIQKKNKQKRTSQQASAPCLLAKGYILWFNFPFCLCYSPNISRTTLSPAWSLLMAVSCCGDVSAAATTQEIIGLTRSKHCPDDPLRLLLSVSGPKYVDTHSN